MSRTRERLAEAEEERRLYLMTLYAIRLLLVGHQVRAEHIRKVLEMIDGAIG